MNLNSKLLRDLIGYGLSSALVKSVGLILLPFITYNINADDYGKYELIINFSAFLGIIIGICLDSALMRFWNEFKDNNARREYFSSLYYSIIVFGAFVIIILQIFIILFSHHSIFNEITEIAFIIFINSYFTALNSLPIALLRLKRKILLYNFLVLTQVTTYLLVSVYGIYYYDYDYIDIFRTFFLSNALLLLLLIGCSCRYFTFHLNIVKVRMALKYSLPLIPAVIATLINQFCDKLIIAYNLGIESVGFYSGVAKIASILAFLVFVFRQSWTPLSIEALELVELKRNVLYRDILHKYFSILLTVSFVLTVLTHFYLHILIPESYYNTISIIPWILGAIVFHGASSLTNLGTVITKKTISNSYAAWIGLFFNIIISIILIQLIGLKGAAIGYFISEFIFMSYLNYRSYTIAKLNLLSNKIIIYCTIYLLFSVYFCFYIHI